MKLGLKKIHNERITEQEYRSIRSAISYSALKKFETSRQSFYKEFILGELPQDKDTASKTLGSLVHTLLAGEEGYFDTKFQLAGAKPPTGQMGELVENLYSRYLKSIDKETGVQQDKFEVIFGDAFLYTKYNHAGEEVAFKKKEVEKVLEMFQTDGEMFFKEKIDAIGKTIVTVQQIEQAEKLVNKLKSHPYTSEYVNMETTDDVDVFNELPILYKMHEVEFKSMPDKLIVRHDTKEIDILDYKTSWQTSDGGLAYTYLQMSYYLQAALYYQCIRHWADQHEETRGYTVNPMKFLFIDVQGFMDPVIMTLTDDDVDRAWRGFTVAGRVYKGTKQIIDEILWCAETGNWGTNETLHNSKGKMRLQLRYGSR